MSNDERFQRTADMFARLRQVQEDRVALARLVEEAGAGATAADLQVVAAAREARAFRDAARVLRPSMIERARAGYDGRGYRAARARWKRARARAQ